MRFRNLEQLLRTGLIIAITLVIIMVGVYGALNFFTPTPGPEITEPISLIIPTPSPIFLATITPTPTALPTPTPIATLLPPTLTATATPVVPTGGIIYAISPDVNSVGWVQSEEKGNHFGESFLYVGLRDTALYHGAMQFNLAFIPKGSTIFLAQLELTGLTEQGVTADNAFQVNILTDTIDSNWSRHDFEIIHKAEVDESLSPILKAADLGQGRVNKIVFNAAQRSIIQERLKTRTISFRIDSLTPDQPGWFGWDSGYGEQTRGQGPILRVGVLPPVATAESTAELTELGTSTATPTLVVITSTPTPENIQTLAAVVPTMTYIAATTGTPTPLPPNWVTPIVVTVTPTPENTATATFLVAEARAAVIAFGTPTPTPGNVALATPTPTATATPVFILLKGELPQITPLPVFTQTAQYIPLSLIGKIAFKSDRTGKEEIYVINPDGSGLALLTNCWAYVLAEQADTYSADGRYRIFTKDAIRYKADPSNPEEDAPPIRADVPALYWYDAFYKKEEQLTQFGAGIAYGGTWSPTYEQIAFVSNDSQNDEIWVVNRDGSGLLQLTRDQYSWWDKHPSWSPDGKQIVFWSNRTGHGQIFVMNPDGSNLYSLSRTGFNDTDPVWIKYKGIPVLNPDSEDGQPSYIGSFGYCTGGEDLNCPAFQTQAEAQSVYNAFGGPLLDPYGLDLDHNGKACESLP